MSEHDDVHEPEADPKDLFERHKLTGEPLTQGECLRVIDARVAPRSEFSMRGGNLWWHDPSFPDPNADDEPTELPCPQDMATAEAFGDWLTAEVDRWCEVEGLTPHGEGENLGDLYRELDIADVFDRIGVTAVPAYECQTLYLVGPDAVWIAATGIGLGAEGETVLFDPLNNLRLDVPAAELIAYRDRLLHVAKEITAVLDRGEGP